MDLKQPEFGDMIKYRDATGAETLRCVHATRASRPDRAEALSSDMHVDVYVVETDCDIENVPYGTGPGTWSWL